ATMVLLRALALLALVVSVSESQGPGTILLSSPFNCSSHMPTLELLHVQPSTTFFNPPSLTRWQEIYAGEVTLSTLARLDALVVNHYELQLQFTCGNHVMERLLSVDVQRDPGHIQCAGRFASPAGEIIQVPETVTPGALLYTLLLPGLELQGAQISITSAQDPPHFPGLFSINGQGWLQASSQGLKGQAQKLSMTWDREIYMDWANNGQSHHLLEVFQLKISVTFGQNRSYHGMLMVEVLPVPSSQVSFLPRISLSSRTWSPGVRWFRSRPRGFDVRYEIVSPVPCRLFSIGRADCMVRTTAPLELTTEAAGAAITRLQVMAFERLRPWTSVELHLTVKVRSINRWPPCCLSALLV
ncbi:hypothetical protein HPG69_012789, partial [Diceros bicornis minor]